MVYSKDSAHLKLAALEVLKRELQKKLEIELELLRDSRKFDLRFRRSTLVPNFSHLKFIEKFRISYSLIY